MLDFLSNFNLLNGELLFSSVIFLKVSAVFFFFFSKQCHWFFNCKGMLLMEFDNVIQVHVLALTHDNIV